MPKTKFQQYLPGYIENLKTDSRWLKQTSRHYEFYYFSNSVAEKEIREIKARQEKAFKKIISFLKVKPPKQKIKYYLYPNPKIKKALMGDDWYAQSIYKDLTAHVLYTGKIKPIGEHEDTHLLSLPWGLSVGFFQEGLAEYLVGHNWYGQSHDELAKKALKKKILPLFRSMFSHKNWTKLDDKNILYYYCFTGSMIRFLIDTYGKNKFKRLYQQTSREKSLKENILAFQKIYNQTPNRVEQNWISVIINNQ